MTTLAIDVPKEQLREFCRRWKVTEFALFGSVTRPEEFGEDSDVDVIVQFAPDAPLSLDGWLSMKQELAEIFGREIDLLDRSSVEEMRNYLRRAAILQTAVDLDVA
jgi:predicted nucleotidyltransferase